MTLNTLEDSHYNYIMTSAHHLAAVRLDRTAFIDGFLRSVAAFADLVPARHRAQTSAWLSGYRAASSSSHARWQAAKARGGVFFPLCKSDAEIAADAAYPAV
jgi:hypothetical protein